MGGPTSPVPWASYSVGDVLYWNGTSFVRLAPGPAGQALLTGGAGVAPSWGSAGVTAHNGLTGLTSGDDHTQYVRLAPTTTARNTIQASTQTVYGLTIKAPADSTYDAYYPIFAVQKHDGTNLIRGWSYFNQTYLEMSGSGGTYITGNGNFRISAGGYDVFQLRSPMTSAAVELYCNQATQPVLDVKMFASQSADGFRLKTSSGTVVVSMSPAGALTAASTVQAPSFYQNASGNFLYLTQMRFREAGGSAFALTLGNAAIGFYAAAAVTQQTVSGSRGGNAALADLLTKLATLGLIVDGSSA